MRRRLDSGSTLVSVLIIATIIMVFSVTVVSMTFQSIAQFKSDYNYSQALINARTAIKNVYLQLKQEVASQHANDGTESTGMTFSVTSPLPDVQASPFSVELQTPMENRSINGIQQTLPVSTSTPWGPATYTFTVTNLNSGVIKVPFTVHGYSNGTAVDLDTSISIPVNGSSSSSTGNGQPNQYSFSLSNYSGPTLNVQQNGDQVIIQGPTQDTLNVINGSVSGTGSGDITWTNVGSAAKLSHKSSYKVTGINTTVSGNNNQGSLWVQGQGIQVSANINNGFLIDTGDQMNFSGNLNNSPATIITGNGAGISGNLNNAVMIAIGNSEIVSGNMNNSMVILMGNSDEITGNTGDTFFSGNNLTISGNVNGCFAAISGEVTVQGNTDDSVYFTGTSLTIGGNMNGTLYMSGDVTVDGNVGNVVKTAGAKLRVSGHINGSVQVASALPTISKLYSENNFCYSLDGTGTLSNTGSNNSSVSLSINAPTIQ